MMRNLYRGCMQRAERLEREVSQATKEHVFKSITAGGMHLSDYEAVVGSQSAFRRKVSKPLRKLRRALIVMALIRVFSPSSVSGFTASEDAVNRLLIDLSIAKSNKTISEQEYKDSVDKIKKM